MESGRIQQQVLRVLYARIKRYRLYKIGWEKTKSVRRIAAILFDVQVYTSIVLSATCLVGAPDSKDLLCVSYVIIISKAATN